MRNTNQLDSASAPKGDDAARERLLKLLLAAERKRAEGTVLPRGHWQGPLPLSYAQERLWFLDQVGLVGTAYNVPLALRLVGDLSEPALERSFNELIRRHESLRTRFGARDGVPYQLIDPPRSLDLCRVDFEEAHGTELRLRELMSRERVHRFDLREGPLFRVTLVKLSAREHALFADDAPHRLGWLVVRRPDARAQRVVCGVRAERTESAAGCWKCSTRTTRSGSASGCRARCWRSS